MKLLRHIATHTETHERFYTADDGNVYRVTNDGRPRAIRYGNMLDFLRDLEAGVYGSLIMREV